LSDLEKEGMIQRFEYSFELAWKTLKDFLASQAIDASFPREVIKQSFHYELIDNGEIWMDMLERRNMLAHTYNEENFRQAIDLITNYYFKEIEKLYFLLESKK
jgi:nucleotidyltransferase substrate binding protein (TIGR01987 family)